MDVEALAREADLPEARTLAFRRERGQSLTLPESADWAGVLRFAALVLEEAAKVAERSQAGDYRRQSRLDTGRSCAAAIRALKPKEQP